MPSMVKVKLFVFNFIVSLCTVIFNNFYVD